MRGRISEVGRGPRPSHLEHPSTSSILAIADYCLVESSKRGSDPDSRPTARSAGA
nr:MAG TPA: hypothetical protein [Inoviridae sp.]